MNRNDIIKLAKKAGGSVMEPYDYGEKRARRRAGVCAAVEIGRNMK